MAVSETEWWAWIARLLAVAAIVIYTHQRRRLAADCPSSRFYNAHPCDEDSVVPGKVLRGTCCVSRRNGPLIVHLIFKCLKTLLFDFWKLSDTDDLSVRVSQRPACLAGHSLVFDTERRERPGPLLERPL